jgi:hypothetical protein
MWLFNGRTYGFELWAANTPYAAARFPCLSQKLDEAEKMAALAGNLRFPYLQHLKHININFQRKSFESQH